MLLGINSPLFNLNYINNMNFFIIRILFSPILPYLPFLLSLVFILVFKSIDSVFLCDGQSISIEEMKESLGSEINKYKDSNFLSEHWKDRAAKEEYYALVDSDEEEMSEWIETCKKRADNNLKQAKEILSKIRCIEETIREKDPNFKSPLVIQNIEK